MAHSFIYWVQELVAQDLLAPGAQLLGLSNPIVDQVVSGTVLVAATKAALEIYVRHFARELGPRGYRCNLLKFGEWRPGISVHANRYGIPEPRCDAAALLSATQIDLVLVPLLGFDRRGNRLGAGAGYYDRSFAFLRATTRPAQPLLVGIGYHFQELPELAPQSWDVPLDFVATDRELIACDLRNRESI